MITWKSVFVGSWAGMRGILTLAAVAGIPLTTLSGTPFPDRGAIQQIAFIVVVGTVLIQGLSLPWVVTSLHFDAGAESARAAAMARESARAIEVALAAAGPVGVGPQRFDLARQTVITELRARRLDDLTAAEEIHRLDLEQTAAEAGASGNPPPHDANVTIPA